MAWPDLLRPIAPCPQLVGTRVASPSSMVATIDGTELEGSAVAVASTDGVLGVSTAGSGVSTDLVGLEGVVSG